MKEDDVEHDVGHTSYDNPAMCEHLLYATTLFSAGPPSNDHYIRYFRFLICKLILVQPEMKSKSSPFTH